MPLIMYGIRVNRSMARIEKRRRSRGRGNTALTGSRLDDKPDDGNAGNSRT